MAFTKITQQELNSRGCTTLPNQPMISAQALKQEFDAPAKEIVAPKFNGLVDELEATTAAASIGVVTPTGRTGNTVQALFNNISADIGEAVADAHTHDNKALLDTYDQTNSDITDAISKKHEHSNKALLDTYTQTESDLSDAVSKKHSHSNKALLDTYTQTEADLASAVADDHTHSNKAVLDKFGESSGKPTYDGSPIGEGCSIDVIAEEFSASKTYYNNHYCIYEGELYRAITTHRGAWDSADFAKTTVGWDLMIKPYIRNIAKNYNYNSSYQAGVYVNLNSVIYKSKQAVPSGTTPPSDEYWEEAVIASDLRTVRLATEKAYQTDNASSTDLDDADYVPFYDSSASEKRKTLWSNIKSVLKTYFDTIYSTFSGSYNDLSDKPTIPAAQVNSDWNASSGVAQILNKPALDEWTSAVTASTSGSDVVAVFDNLDDDYGYFPYFEDELIGIKAVTKGTGTTTGTIKLTYTLKGATSGTTQCYLRIMK